MERKAPFLENEYYHLYSRGVEKRLIFHDHIDKNRFLLLLSLCNSLESVRVDDVLKSQGEPLRNAASKHQKDHELVSIIGYALMDNHVHLIARENKAGGISKFMLKLMTAYSMYFNTKYERSGPLFTRPFRSSHIDSDEYFRWVFAYLHVNPLEIHQGDWRQAGIRNRADAQQFMQTYRYSSFPDYFGEERAEAHIITKTGLPFDLAEVRGLDGMLEELAAHPDITAGYTESVFPRPRATSALV